MKQFDLDWSLAQIAAHPLLCIAWIVGIGIAGSLPFTYRMVAHWLRLFFLGNRITHDYRWDHPGWHPPSLD